MRGMGGAGLRGASARVGAARRQSDGRPRQAAPKGAPPADPDSKRFAVVGRWGSGAAIGSRPEARPNSVPRAETPRSRPRRPALGDALEEPGCAHAAADAHRDDAVLAAAAPELVEELRGELRAGAPERVAERDRAAVHVEPIVRDAELARAVEGLAREGLVDLEEIDVRDLHARSSRGAS